MVHDEKRETEDYSREEGRISQRKWGRVDDDETRQMCQKMIAAKNTFFLF